MVLTGAVSSFFKSTPHLPEFLTIRKAQHDLDYRFAVQALLPRAILPLGLMMATSCAMTGNTRNSSEVSEILYRKAD